MKERLLLGLGMLWALPVSLLAFAYVSLFWALRWYSYVGWRGSAWVWTLDEKRAPGFLVSLWKGWAGHSIGSLIVVGRPALAEPTSPTLAHERAHTEQSMILGPFAPVLYLVALFTAWVLPGMSAYKDCVFEVAARRNAPRWME